MLLKRLGLAGLLGALALGTAACTDGYGYSGVGMAWGGGGYDPYYDGGWGGAGFAGPGWGGAGWGGSPYYGWYDNFYYPGTGVFVYDRYRRAHRWTGPQQRFWNDRRRGWAGRDVRPNWGGFRGERDWNRPGRRDGGAIGRPGFRNDGPGLRGERGWRSPDGRGGERIAPGARSPRGEGFRGERSGRGGPPRGPRP